jgi:hypothetical protein
MPVRLGFALLCAWAAACTGGQSGTETPKMIGDAGPPPPPNQHAGPDFPDGGGVVTKAGIVAPCECIAGPGAALLRATLEKVDACTARVRVQGVLAPKDASVQPGDVVSGARASAAECGHGLELAAGDEVLVVYAPVPGSGNQLVLARYGDPFVFGYAGKQAVTLAQKDADRLLDLAACTAVFGRQAAPSGDAGAAPVCGPLAP